MNSLLEDLQPKDQEKIKRISRRLLAETFIVKNKDAVSLDDYNFIRKNLDLLNDMLSVLGYYVVVEKASDIAILSLDPQNKDMAFANRVSFSYRQTILVLILWQYYFKTKQKLTEHVILTKEQLDNELKVAKLDMTKTEIKETVKKLKQHNVVDYDGSSDITVNGNQIYIYPSIMQCINFDECNELYENMNDSIYEERIDENSEDYVEEDC